MRLVFDEDGFLCDERDFIAGTTRFCANCEGDLGGYYHTGQLCEDCEAAAGKEVAA